MENVYKHIFWGKTIYLIWNTFLTILCDQDLNFKVLLKVIKLEGSFFVIKAKLVKQT